MANDMTAADVMDAVYDLKNSDQMQDLHHDVKLRLEQHAMTDIPYVPEWLQQQSKVQVLNSPRVAETARQIGTIVASYQTTVTVTPDDPSDSHKADIAEKAYAMRRQSLFTPQVLSTKRWEQMINAYGFYHLICGDTDSADPFTVEAPDILGCYFTINPHVSMRPTQMAREYEQQFKDLPLYYDSRHETAHIFDGNDWQEMRLTEDQSKEFYASLPKEIKGKSKNFTINEFDDGEYTYIVGLNDKKSGAKLLKKRKNLTGGVAYTMVPGYLTGSREYREKFLPHLWAPMNIQNQIDAINTLRFTRSMNLKPQVLMARNPELFKSLLAMGMMKPVPQTGYEISGPNSIIELNGTPYMWELPSDEDLALLEQSKIAELNDYISTELSLTRGDVIKDSPVRNVQLALGARAQQQAFLLLYNDIGMRDILDMWRCAQTHPEGYGADERSMTAYEDARYSKGIARKGERVKIKAEDFDFEHRVNVTTASMSPEEQDYMVQMMLTRKQSGIATWPQVLETVYQNVTEQEEELVKEQAYEAASSYLAPWLQPTFEKRMAERHGILIRAPQLEGAGDPTAALAQTSSAPGLPANSFPKPQVNAPTGGTTDQPQRGPQ